MKYLLFMVISFLISCSPNNITIKNYFPIIELEEYYRGQGVIVPDTSMEYFGIDSTKFTPSLEQVKLAELILKDDLYNYYWKVYYFSGFFNNETKDSTELYEEFKEEVSQYKNDLTYFNRYYLGYRNEKNENIIVISIFDVSTFKTKKMFENWENKYYWYLSSYPEFMRSYRINLNDNEIEHY